MDPILRFDRVSKDYGANGERVHALADISFTAAAGEFMAIMGRSGCGKSTLLNLAGAMDFPSRGDVIVDGQTTNRLDDRRLTRLRREKVGFVFQSFQLLPNMTVVENVELPLLLASAPKARHQAREALAWVELADHADRMPHQLSGGQMQRVAIARALVHRPKLLLADEPTGNLDSATGEMVLKLLRRAAAEHHALVLMATHSTESAAFCDHVIRLRDGRIDS